MSNTFKTTKLANHRVLVQGSGKGEAQVLDSTEWDYLTKKSIVDVAAAAFDDKIKEFFAPLTEAAEAVAEAVANESKQDPAFFIVTQEQVTGTPAVAEEITYLSHDSVILRLIDEGKTDRLIWVGGSIEITAL